MPHGVKHLLYHVSYHWCELSGHVMSEKPETGSFWCENSFVGVETNFHVNLTRFHTKSTRFHTKVWFK